MNKKESSDDSDDFVIVNEYDYNFERKNCRKIIDWIEEEVEFLSKDDVLN
jgi:hypothetical protein